MGWAPDPTKFSESLSEKKGPKGRLFALDNGDKLETPAHKWRKRKEGKKEREGRKQENRKIAMAGLTFSSYMMVTSIWRKFLAEKKYTCLKEEVYLAVTFSKIRVDVYFFVCFPYSWSVSKGSALATKQLEANSVFLLIQVSKLIFNLLSRRLW